MIWRAMGEQLRGWRVKPQRRATGQRWASAADQLDSSTTPPTQGGAALCLSLAVGLGVSILASAASASASGSASSLGSSAPIVRPSATSVGPDPQISGPDATGEVSDDESDRDAQPGPEPGAGAESAEDPAESEVDLLAAYLDRLDAYRGPDFRNALESGRQALQAGRSEDAIVALQRAVGLSEHHVVARHLLALAYLTADDRTAAYEELRDAFFRFPAWAQLGGSYRVPDLLGDGSQGDDRLADLLSNLEPETSRRDAFLRGYLLMFSNRPQEAAQAFNDARPSEPTEDRSEDPLPDFLIDVLVDQGSADPRVTPRRLVLPTEDQQQWLQPIVRDWLGARASGGADDDDDDDEGESSAAEQRARAEQASVRLLSATVERPAPTRLMWAAAACLASGREAWVDRLLARALGNSDPTGLESSDPFGPPPVAWVDLPAASELRIDPNGPQQSSSEADGPAAQSTTSRFSREFRA